MAELLTEKLIQVWFSKNKARENKNYRFFFLQEWIVFGNTIEMV